MLRHVVSGPVIEITALASALDDLSGEDRVRAVRELGKREMERIWAATAGRGVDAEDFCPEGTPAGGEVIHYGKNSLPAFSFFQKRFTPAEGKPGFTYGYNHNWFNFTTAGPGYFIGHYDDLHGEFGLNYYVVPPGHATLPHGWPKIKKNEHGLKRLIYSRMIDYMRKVTDGVTIGRAWKYGKVTDNYFMLVRA